MPRFNGKIHTGLWIGLLVVLAMATLVEKSVGSVAVHRYIYTSWWFTGLWILFAGFSLWSICSSKIYRNKPLFLLHGSFFVILAGALCTKLGGERGQIMLSKGEPAVVENIALPFTVALDTFYVEYYAGTDTPSDYVSVLTVGDPVSGAVQRGRVSMNKIFSYTNYRFYQSSFTPGGTTTLLSINHDPVGIFVTYTGYALFLLSGLWLLSGTIPCRCIKVGALFLVLVSTSWVLHAGTPPQERAMTVTREQARKFGELWMLYDGRITSVSVFARDFTLKLTGKDHFSGLSADQFLVGFLFFPEEWQHVALFELRDPALKEQLHIENQKASFADFFDAGHRYKLTTFPRTKEVKRLHDCIQLIHLLQSGALLRIFPRTEQGALQWYSTAEQLPEDENSASVGTVLTDYRVALHDGDEQQADTILHCIQAFQYQNARMFLPSETDKQAEIFYLQYNGISGLFKFNLTAGVLALVAFFIQKNGKRRRVVEQLFVAGAILSWGYLTASMVLRTYIGGRLPVASGFETMLLLAWIALLAAGVFRRKIPLAVPFGLLLSGCALLVAHLGAIHPKITPLVPVLSSPLLSLHVSVLMIAYVLLAFTALNGFISLWVFAFSKEKGVLQQARQNSLLCLRPALYFLGTGICIGAVWANVSWGSYWSWDPKEVWALITFLLYALILHRRDLSPVVFHRFVVAAFGSVLVTWFGVNYFFGGMHGYM